MLASGRMAEPRTRPGPHTRTRLLAYRDGAAGERTDHVATEEPLEIRVAAAGDRHPAAVTMRTPGNDFELAAGFLFAEGVIAGHEDIERIAYCVESDLDEEQRYNVVTVDLAPGCALPSGRLERHFAMTSACGVCGKATLEALELRGLERVGGAAAVTREVLGVLPERLRAAQGVFARTGGLHAAGLFTPDGTLVAVREDVGRHNALDKLIGWALLDRRLPLEDCVALVSGRASYELVQKSLAARVPVLCAVSAPSSLAVELARRFGITLVGFLRDSRFNVYAGAQRIL